ncbi:hypothetical protein GCM10022261_14560 [Brevibacterium daeguense]|uniref:Spermidine/putrescine transport system substrate-binding protein n=1 Tax=Brevibacterium daeguense TaxID=909936 RepID=A0ABP8EIY4_9MICO|nr:hypothetical protein [Brevibacterium daeguense]
MVRQLLVPLAATHKANAEALMNYYYDPAVAAEVAAYVNYICPVQGAREAMEKLDPSLVDNPLIFPTDEFLENVSAMRPVEREEEQKYIDMFQRAIGK